MFHGGSLCRVSTCSDYNLYIQMNPYVTKQLQAVYFMFLCRVPDSQSVGFEFESWLGVVMPVTKQYNLVLV